jgi:hypothetical protein
VPPVAPRGLTESRLAKATGVEVVVSETVDFAALEAKWRDLETRSDASFFQSWTWTGCLVAERFPDPVLVEACENGRSVALALFNRRGRTLYLGESGDPARDCIYIEFNGVLAETGREDELTKACLRAARGRMRWPWTPSDRRSPSKDKASWACNLKRRLVLNGVGATMVSSVAEIAFVLCDRSLAAPFAEIGIDKGCFLDTRSANTRQQVRRSDRYYAANGAIAIDRAETPERAHEYLDRLAAMHQATWIARGLPGAFAAPFFSRFHRALIERGLPRQEIDLLHISAGSQTIGYLYNFRFRDRSLAYQSGFDYPAAGRHGKPGMSCHRRAIQFAAERGATSYHFLAGDDRYKRSLSNRSETLYWVEAGIEYSPRFLIRRALKLLRRGQRTDSPDSQD